MDPSINRRKLLAGAGVLASAAALPGVGAAAMQHHHEASPQDGALQTALGNCVTAGERCAAHCLESFQRGETMLAQCASAVHEMTAVCEAMARLVATNSAHRTAMGEVCAAVCKACAEACNEHAGTHDTCRDCRDACQQVVDALAS